MVSPILIDGSILEGGGQILRNCVAYSMLTMRPLAIHSIRGNRKKPGLQLQHLTGIRLATEMSKATVTGVEKDSTELTFYPKELHGQFHVAEIPSAGACTLVLQLALPVVIGHNNDIHLIVKGGTNVPMSPSIEYVKNVLLPTLSTAFGISGIQLDVIKRGFMPMGGGELSLRIKGGRSSKFPPCDILNKGQVISYEAIFVGHCTSKFLDEIVAEVAKQSKYVFVSEAKPEEKSRSTQTQILLVAKTDTGCIFGASALGGKNQTGAKLFRAAEKMLAKQIAGSWCVDEYLQDQLIIYMALAYGQSKIRTGPLTLHTQTAIHFAQLMTGARFKVEKDEKDEYGSYIITCDTS